MFAKTVIDSDAFLDMPMSAQCLYFHLGMRADDDGFLNNPKKIQRMVGASDDDFKLLIMKRFVIVFETGVMVIKHWRLHNYIQKDRYKPTVYQDELAMLTVKENGEYTECVQDVYTGKVSIELGKNRIELGKDSVGDSCADKPPQKKRFEAPTREEVQQYITEQGYHVDADRFVDYYTSNGWMVGKNHMKDWKAAVRTWERKEKKQGEEKTNNIFLQMYEEQYGQTTNNDYPFGS